MRRKPKRSAEERAAAADGNVVRPATREETMPLVMAALVTAFAAMVVCLSKSYTLLYGDAVAHLGIARRVLDAREPGWGQLGGVWLPLPHLLILPLVQKMEWWQNGMAGTWPSMLCYVAGVAGFYRLARRMLIARWAVVATAFLALNPNLLYLSTTAMTEPLFVALMIWCVLATVECVEAMRGRAVRMAQRKMWQTGWLVMAAVYTRYDGWVLAAAVWCVIAWELRRSGLWSQAGKSFRWFTVLVVAGPLGWLGYNAKFFHDPLDFMRGPYSAGAILRRTTPSGATYYPGWHDPLYALKLYVHTVLTDAVMWSVGYALVAVAVAGLCLTWWRRLPKAATLLWVPLPFYVYSIAYGSVPIFIPALWPHSYYNSRYGMALLPALALFGGLAVAAAETWVREHESSGWKLAARLMQPLMLMLVALNTVMMMHVVPLVLKEAQVNASTRMPFEKALADTLSGLPPGSTVLMSSSDHIGAIERAGIPLRQTVNEGDYVEWPPAMLDPSRAAAYVIAVQGDPVDAAVKAHPEGLMELSIVCSTGQPCARVYKSDDYGVH